MKKYIRNTVASLLLLVFILSSYIPTFAVGQPSTYSGKSNSGQRDVVCTTLNGTGALDYYTGSYSYDSLDDLSSSALLTTLRTLMTSTHKTTSDYDDCKDMAKYTDCQNGDGNKVLLLYTSVYTTKSGNNGWNREHVWPKSLGGYNTSGPGADLHHIRPTDDKVNSDRGNLKFGNLNGGGSPSYGNQAADGVLGGYKGGYFEPLDNAKGDVARICLYMYVRYGGSYSKCSSITNVFQSVDVLLEWCALDPVDTWEMGRNEVVEDFQGNRNVFIDYPELAWLLFGKQMPSSMTTPSGKASGNSSGSQGGNSGNQGGENQGGNQGGTDTPSCSHSNTEIRNAVAADCHTDGYTGDVYCKSCGVKLSSGNTIPSTGAHIFGEWTPSADGKTYVGTCTRCGETQTLTVDSILTEIDTDAEKLLILLALGACDGLILSELSR